MSNQITWVEPNTPPIPDGWFVLINDVNGTAYEEYSDYLAAYNALLDTGIVNPNPDEL